MSRLMPVISLVTIGIMVWAIADILLIDSGRVRGLPKFGWILLIVLLPIIGTVLWVTIGRVRLERPNHGRYRDEPLGAASSASSAPDDDPAFLQRLRRDQQQEERIRELERRLAELDDGDSPKKDPAKE